MSKIGRYTHRKRGLETDRHTNAL